MRRLIHHERGATWDLVEEDGAVWVEHVRANQRKRVRIDAFRKTAEGERFAIRLDSMLGQTSAIAATPPTPPAIFWFPRA